MDAIFRPCRLLEVFNLTVIEEGLNYEVLLHAAASNRLFLTLY